MEVNNKKVITKKEYTDLINNVGAISILGASLSGLVTPVELGLIDAVDICKTLQELHNSLIDDVGEKLVELGIKDEVEAFSLQEIIDNTVVVEG